MLASTPPPQLRPTATRLECAAASSAHTQANELLTHSKWLALAWSAACLIPFGLHLNAHEPLMDFAAPMRRPNINKALFPLH